MVDLKPRIIQGHTVQVVPFTGSRANKNFVRYTQSLSGNQIICHPDQWQEFCNEFLSGVVIDNKDMSRTENFDSTFQGAIDFLMEVIVYVAEVNFGKGFLSTGGDTGNTQESQTKKIKG
jgi:hypothetical protein